MWGRCSFRLSDIDFEANLKDGIATDWPIRYADDRALVQPRRAVRGNRWIEGGARRSSLTATFSLPMALNCAEELIASRLTRLLRRQAPADLQSNGEPHPAAARARILSVPRRLLAGLPLRRVLQHAVGDAARRHAHRSPNASALRHRDRKSSTTAIASARRASASSMPSATRRPTTPPKSSSSAPPRSTPPGCSCSSATDVWPGGSAAAQASSGTT